MLETVEIDEHTPPHEQKGESRGPRQIPVRGTHMTSKYWILGGG